MIEAHHLVLDTGTVAGSHPFDGAVVHGRAVNIGANDVVGPLVGPSEIAGLLLDEFGVGEVAKTVHVRISLFHFHLAIIYTVARNTRGRTRFETTNGNAQSRERLG